MNKKRLLTVILAAVLLFTSIPSTAMGSDFHDNSGAFEAAKQTEVSNTFPEEELSLEPSVENNAPKDEGGWEAEFPSNEIPDTPVLMKEDIPDETPAIPSENDYAFSNGVITGLKSEYKSSLTEEQKKNISLVIPDTIGETPVTKIDNNAFNYTFNSGFQFTHLDLSGATHLQSIGEHAFDSAKFTGLLTIPASVKEIGNYAFYCCNFSGKLTLPEGLEVIGNSAFKLNQPFTGFSGELIIPESVKKIETAAFSNQKSITSVSFQGNSLTELSDSVFRSASSLTGAITIPDSVQKMGKNLFADTNIKTIYLPKRQNAANNTFIRDTTFNTSSINAIVCCPEDYEFVHDTVKPALQAKVGYEIQVDFSANNGQTFDPIARLYNRPYNYVKGTDGVWDADGNYQFPSITPLPGEKPMAWGLSPDSIKVTQVNDIIQQSSLYAIQPLEDPVITFGTGVDKIYDGLPSSLTVTATHSLAKKASEAGPGDVVFHYTWSWATIGFSPAVLTGFDKNIYKITDVREPRYAISCSVKVMACRVNNANKAIPFKTLTHSFSVNMLQAEPVVHPVYSQGPILIGDGMPVITLSPGDTPGTIAWDDGQTLQEGTHDYSWSFIPTGNAVGSCNFKAVTGTATLNGTSSLTPVIPPPRPNENPVIADRPTEDNPDQPTTAEPAAPVHTDNSGNAILNDSQIDDIISAAQNYSQAMGFPTGIAVSIPLQVPKETSELHITVPAQTLDALVSHQVQYMELSAENMISYRLPLDTMNVLAAQNPNDDITINAAKAEVSGEYAAAIGSRPAYDISIYGCRDGEAFPISDLQGETFGLKLPYTPEENEDISKLYSTYIDENGKLQWMKASYLPDEKAVSFDIDSPGICSIGYLDLYSTPPFVESKTNTQVSVGWKEDPLAQGYTVWYRSEYENAYMRKIISTPEQLTWDCKSLKPGTKYFYTVRPWVLTDDGYVFGTVAPTIRGTTKPEAAKIQRITENAGSFKVILAGPADGARLYSMCYSKTPDFSDFKVGIRTAYTTRTCPKTLPAGTYYVRVKSYRDLGNGKRVYGEWSNTVRIHL